MNTYEKIYTLLTEGIRRTERQIRSAHKRGDRAEVARLMRKGGAQKKEGEERFEAAKGRAQRLIDMGQDRDDIEVSDIYPKMKRGFQHKREAGKAMDDRGYVPELSWHHARTKVGGRALARGMGGPPVKPRGRISQMDFERKFRDTGRQTPEGR